MKVRLGRVPSACWEAASGEVAPRDARVPGAARPHAERLGVTAEGRSPRSG
jgi:hypothetical protein